MPAYLSVPVDCGEGRFYLHFVGLIIGNEVLGEGMTRGKERKGDNGRQDIKFVCGYGGSFRVPDQYATALREHWWSVLAESPLSAVITSSNMVWLLLVVLCDSLRCGAYGTYCYGIS